MASGGGYGRVYRGAGAMNSFYLDKFHAYKDQGNTANRNGHYRDAGELYTLALQQVELISSGICDRDVAKVFSNRSLAALKLGWIEPAFEDGMKCIQIDPTWVKGYWRVSSALKGKNEPIQALHVLVTGYSKIKGDNEEATNNKIDFIKEIATLSEILIAWPEAFELFYSCTAPPKVWTKVVQQLSRQKQTKVLHLVFLGGGPMVQAGIGGMASNCDASLVELKPLIRSMGPSDRNQYGMDLMLVLIKHGADWTGLSINPGDTPLHVVLNHGMEIGNHDFLKYIFSHHAKTRVERSQTDSEGATLLHIAAKQKGKRRQTAVLFLLKENVDPSIKDNKGKTPADYIDDWRLVSTLRSEMKRSKHENYPSQSAVGNPRNDITKQKQQKFYQSGPQGSGQLPSPMVLPERVRRPYSLSDISNEHEFSQPISSQWASQNENDMEYDITNKRQSRFDQSGPQSSGQLPNPTVLPERTRRPYSSTATSQHQPQRSKTNMNQNAKKQKEQVAEYERGCQLKELKHYDQALKVFLECMANKNARQSELVEKCKQEVINTLELSGLKEISQDVMFSMNPFFWNQTMLELQETNRWRVMFLLLNGGGNYYKYGEGGVATGCNVSQVSILKCLKSKTENVRKIEVIKALLENGAKPNGLPNEKESPVEYCLRVPKHEHYVIITALIRQEARPEDLIEVPGDSPLHSGLRLCLQCKDKKMELLNVLLDKYSKMKDERYMDPTETNTRNDDTLFHIALNEKDEALSLEAVRLLSRNKVNPYLMNKAGKIPITQIKKSDRRYQFLEEAARYHSKKAKRGLYVKKRTFLAPGIDKQEVKRKIARLIDNVLPVIKQARVENKKLQKQRDSTSQPKQTEEKKVEDDNESGKPDVKKPERKEPGELEPADSQEIDSTVFDNLTWEVECTANVWKFLRDRRVPEKIKQAVVNKVRLLGEGNWSKSLAKRLKGKARDHNIYLYEVKLTSGGRIVWQKAIAFSPKLSVVPEDRLTEHKQDFGWVEGGRIYADVIRVWDVVLDHDNVAHAIDVIVKSVDRGQECILQKKLKGLKNNSIGQAMKIPNLYQEVLLEDVPQTSNKKQDFFPPASSKETEYHIMKFYSFSSSLVNNILHDCNTRVDFPFRVTEKEHAIIHINPKPPCSLLLLGRSGTGKTTCCLYRLWSCFLTYWNNAAVDGEPRIPRDFSFCHSKDATNEKLDDESDGSEMLPTDAQVPEGAVANPDGSAVGDGAVANEDCTDDEDEHEIVYDHLHQIFITKNRVLCSEVRKNFRELAHGCNVASHYLKAEDQQHPHRLQDAPITAFPYFLTSRQFLLMLDASLPGTPFFERNPDGSLKKVIQGWQEGDGQQPILEMMEDDSDDEEDEEEDGEENEVEFDPDAEEKVQRKKGTHDVRHEVTYEVFANNLWKKINKKHLDYHPTLAWMEIRSFIKGSIEALHSEKGNLELEDYQKLGKKRAPNFTGDRKLVYELFKKYEHMKKQRFYFDEADVVFNIYRRLQDVETPDWAIHQIFVDETQDFTQAELALLIRCCSDPNAIFLTGDTAQSIMRGVAFRFDDLKSLFHYARNSMKVLGKQSSVAVPKNVYQLTHNYRSHAGILELAASVVDLLFFFFPSSFDRLRRDQGLFDGPKPVLLDSCSTSDLALILRGNKRKTSQIEFGAHQVILVANEQAKKQLPEELSLALCLTIFEAKGLEFDDVMIYNFFKDSPAREEWRVVQEHLQDIQKQTSDTKCSNTSNLFELDIDVMNSAEQPRRLAFDPNKHKVLNSELKYLYTSISRARVNVWIFDEDTDNRRPMFQYFKARKLVRVLDAEHDISDESRSLDVMFVEKSSEEDWEKRGDYFYNNGLWEIAVKCYTRAGNDEKVLKAKANHRVYEAEKLKGTNVSKMCDWFLEAAYDFLQCGMHSEAARCLFNTKAYNLSAQLFEKIGDVAGAAKIYETRLKSYGDSSRCHEKRGDYAMAVKVLKQNKEYDKAADVIERYEQRKSDHALQGTLVPENFIAPQDTIETCCHRAANHHFQHQAYDKMLESLNRLPNVDDRITFLKSRGQHRYAVEILKGEGRLKDAAEILKATGDLLQAIELCGEDHPEFCAECHLKFAKQKMRQLRDLGLSKPIVGEEWNCSKKANMETCEIASLRTNSPRYEPKRKALVEIIKKHAEESLMLLKMSKDSTKRLFGDCEFILAVLNNNVSILKDATRHFREASSDAGLMECIHLRIELRDHVHTSTIIDCLTNLYDFIQVLKNYDGAKNQQKVNTAEHFYDIDLGASPQTTTQSGGDKFKLARLEVVRNHCLPKAVIWFNLVKEKLENTAMKTKQCQLYATGRPCTRNDCKHLHSFYRRDSILELVDCFVSMIKFVNCANQWKQLILGEACIDFQSITDEIIRWEYEPCSELYDLVFPFHCNQRILKKNQEVIRDLLRIIRRPPVVKQQMTAWVLNLRKSLDNRNKNCDSNFYIKALNVHRLVEENPNVIKLWMKEDETQCTKYSFQNPKARRPLGMILLEGGRMVSFMDRLFEYTNDLYVHGEPMKAIDSCNKFLVFIAKRPCFPLIPSIANTVAIIEHAFTVACAVIAKAEKCDVFLPASYLAQIQFQDELCRPLNGRFNVYQAVDLTDNFKRNELLRQVRNFVEMMTCGDKYRNFDIIPDAFKSRQYIESGEAERSLILALVMLCNYRSLLSFESAFHLRCQLMHIQTDQRYPPRLARAVESVKCAKSLKDIMDVLQELLMQREAEFLLACHWRYHTLNYRYANVVTEYYKDILGSLEGMLPMEPIIAQDNTAMNQDIRGDVDTDAEQKEFERAIDFKNKCTLISKIRSNLPTRRKIIPELMPTISERGKLAALVSAQLYKESVRKSSKDETKKSDHWVISDIEEKTKVDETWCGICCKGLDAKPDKRDLNVMPSSSIEGEAPKYLMLQREVSVDETKNTQMEEHVLSHEHIENKKYFEAFKQSITSTLLPSLKETLLMNKRLENCTHADLEVFHGRVRESQQHFIKTIKEVIEKRRWGEFENIESALSIFVRSVQDLSEEFKRIERTHETHSNVAAGDPEMDDVAEQIRDEPDDEELHQTLNIGSTRRKRGRDCRRKAKKRKPKK